MTSLEKSYHMSQVISKPNQCPKPARFGKTIVNISAGNRVNICAAPLPRKKLVNQYLITITDCSIRYFEASTLRRINSRSIVRAVVRLHWTKELKHVRFQI